MKSTWRKALVLASLLVVGGVHPPGGITLILAKGESDGTIEPDLRVLVGVYNYAQVEPATLASAEGEAQKIFQRAGLMVEWRNIVISPERTGRVGGAPSDEHDARFPQLYLRVVLSSMSPTNRHEPLGCAPPSSDTRFASDAWVFFDRIERAAKLGIAAPYQILGHAMAHEIGHLLLDPNAHSVTGVMRYNWSTEDFILISQGSLLFTPRHAEQLRLSVQARIQREPLALENNSVNIVRLGPESGRKK